MDMGAFEILERFDVGVTNDYARKRNKYSKIIFFNK